MTILGHPWEPGVSYQCPPAKMGSAVSRSLSLTSNTSTPGVSAAGEPRCCGERLCDHLGWQETGGALYMGGRSSWGFHSAVTKAGVGARAHSGVAPSPLHPELGVSQTCSSSLHQAPLLSPRVGGG